MIFNSASCLICVSLFVNSALLAGSSVYLWPQEVYKNFLDFRFPDKEISVRVEQLIANQRIKCLELKNGNYTVNVNESEFEMYTKPKIDSIAVTGDVKEVDKLYVEIKFLDNEIPVWSHEIRSFSLRLCFKKDKLLYHEIAVIEQNEIFTLFKSPGAQIFYKSFKDITLQE